MRACSCLDRISAVHVGCLEITVDVAQVVFRLNCACRYSKSCPDVSEIGQGGLEEGGAWPSLSESHADSW
jgi:hypothetical protein